MVDVEFEEIWIVEESLREGGVVSVSGVMAGPVWFEHHDRIRFTVLTSDGDEEELLLRPQICRMGGVAGFGASAHTSYFCNQFLLTAETRWDLKGVAHDSFQEISSRRSSSSTLKIPSLVRQWLPPHRGG